MSILVLAEHHEGRLSAGTAHVVGAARAIGGDIDILVAGENVAAIAEAAAKLDGVSRVRVADDATYAATWQRLNTVCANTSVTRVVVGRGGPRLLTFNEHEHLAPDQLTYR